ncbi:hypothetical protein AARI_22210 [Glutamicibacter arilaitensis Re117]|uniref:Gfo/Idh/MocA family oxidoreductase n=1 Tax=Glutamicibacter arilaitensis (strain DSM 16368 / CIP 108037 / IAM 15318 / JCM 13566 / NCIMB 14258 / Re117) TaxID=861360 RepID=A0ABP1U3B9_GLUAR|nr:MULTISPECIES: hypothetical protein [Glutamicibacter]CBT76441.1 hypothetical protein AARI_22210 [Glutamicibacter arilaitensis Re117]
MEVGILGAGIRGLCAVAPAGGSVPDHPPDDIALPVAVTASGHEGAVGEQAEGMQ